MALPHIDASPFHDRDTMTWVSSAHLDPTVHTILATADGVGKGALYAVPTGDGAAPRVFRPGEHEIVWVPNQQVPPPNGLLVACNVPAVDSGYIVKVEASAPAAESAASPSAGSTGKRRAARPRGKRAAASPSGEAPAPPAAVVALDDDDDEEDIPLIRKKKAPRPAAVTLMVKERGTVKASRVKDVIQVVVASLGMASQYTLDAEDGSQKAYYCGTDGVAEMFESHVDVLRHIKDTFHMDVTAELAQRPSSLFSAVVQLADDVFE